jgi:hypothetical protein
MTPEEALALHRDALVIDSHNDSIVAHIRRGNLGLGGEQGPERASRSTLPWRRSFGRSDIWPGTLSLRNTERQRS